MTKEEADICRVKLSWATFFLKKALSEINTLSDGEISHVLLSAEHILPDIEKEIAACISWLEQGQITLQEQINDMDFLMQAYQVKKVG